MIRTFQRKLVVSGAVLFTVGLFTGIWVAMTATGKVVVAIPHLALASHLNGLFGGLWLIAVASSLDFLGYAEAQINRLCLLLMIACWGNWAITLAASILGVRGLSYTGEMSNDVIAFLLQIVVVVPSLFGAAYWVRGLLILDKKGV